MKQDVKTLLKHNPYQRMVYAFIYAFTLAIFVAEGMVYVSSLGRDAMYRYHNPYVYTTSSPNRFAIATLVFLVATLVIKALLVYNVAHGQSIRQTIATIGTTYGRLSETMMWRIGLLILAPLPGCLVSYIAYWLPHAIGLVVFILGLCLSLLMYLYMRYATALAYVVNAKSICTPIEALQASWRITTKHAKSFICMRLSLIHHDIISLLTFGLYDTYYLPYKIAKYTVFIKDKNSFI